MKKIVLASALVLAAGAASAFDISSSVVRDSAVDGNGVKFEVPLTDIPLNGKAGTTISRVETESTRYTSYGVFATVPVTSLFTAQLNAVSSLNYIDRNNGADGFALNVGLQAVQPLSKSTDLKLGVERRIGQHRISDIDTNQYTIGVVTKF